MRCDDVSAVLADLVDGSIDPGTERRVGQHLAGCANCRALVTDLRTIRAAALTLDRREPGPAVWAGIRAAIAAEPRPARRGFSRPSTVAGWGLWLGAAAALLVATAVGVMPLLTPQATPVAGTAAMSPTDGEPTAASVTAEFEAAERHYQKAIADLEAITRQDAAELDPKVVAVLQTNLSVIDQAISESRSALRSQPASHDAQDSLFDILRTKVALLQNTVSLINEMRQGNQAEAGRKFQTLSR